MEQQWIKGYYYDEAQDLTYINRDQLTDDDRKSLIQIVGFSLEWDEESEKYELFEVRYQEGSIFDEQFETIAQAFDRLEAYFDDTVYEWVTDETYPSIWNEHQLAIA